MEAGLINMRQTISPALIVFGVFAIFIWILYHSPDRTIDLKELKVTETCVLDLIQFCADEPNLKQLRDLAIDVRQFTGSRNSYQGISTIVICYDYSKLILRFPQLFTAHPKEDIRFYLTITDVENKQTQWIETVCFSVHTNVGNPLHPFDEPPYYLEIDVKGMYKPHTYTSKLFHISNGLKSEGIIYSDSFQSGWQKEVFLK